MNEKFDFVILGEEMSQKKSFPFRFSEWELEEYMYLARRGYYEKRSITSIIKSILYASGYWKKVNGELKQKQLEEGMSDNALLKEVGKHRYRTGGHRKKAA